MQLQLLAPLVARCTHLWHRPGALQTPPAPGLPLFGCSLSPFATADPTAHVTGQAQAEVLEFWHKLCQGKVLCGNKPAHDTREANPPGFWLPSGVKEHPGDALHTEVGAAAQPLLNGCLEGVAVESTVPILVAGTVPAAAAAANTSPKVPWVPHSRPPSWERKTTGPPACPRADEMALPVKVVPHFRLIAEISGSQARAGAGSQLHASAQPGIPGLGGAAEGRPGRDIFKQQGEKKCK